LENESVRGAPVCHPVRAPNSAHTHIWILVKIECLFMIILALLLLLSNLYY